MAFQYGSGAAAASTDAGKNLLAKEQALASDPFSAMNNHSLEDIAAAAKGVQGVPTNYGGYAGGATDAANNFLAQSAANQQINQPQIQQAQAYGNQGLGYLAQTAEGQGPAQAAAQSQLQQGVSQGMLAQAAAANSARGGGPALAAAQQQGQQNSLSLTQNAGIQAAQLRAQMAGQAQQALVAGAQGAQQVGQQGQQGLAQSEQGYGQLANQALLGEAEDQTQTYATNVGATTAANGQALQQQQQIAGYLGAAAKGAGVLLMSDERVKEGIATADARTAGRYLSDETAKDARSPGTNAADQFLSTLKPYTYEYKSPEDEPSSNGGRYLGIMAQNVERGPTGRTLVTDTPRGKAIEGAASIGAAMAGLGRLHQRVSFLERAAANMGRS